MSCGKKFIFRQLVVTFANFQLNNGVIIQSYRAFKIIVCLESLHSDDKSQEVVNFNDF